MLKQRTKALMFVGVSILAIIYLFPIIWVVVSSFKGGSELFRWPPSFFPNNPTIQNYVDAFARGSFGVYFKNSGVVAVTSTALAVVINIMAGYAFSKYRFLGGNIIFMLFIGTMMLPLEVLMIPIFQMVKNLGLYNTLAGIVIPPAATPTGLFIVRQFFLSVPDELGGKNRRR